MEDLKSHKSNKERSQLKVLVNYLEVLRKRRISYRL